MEKTRDLTTEFSIVEEDIIIDFAKRISADRFDKKISSFGTASYWIYEGSKEIEIRFFNDDRREILVCCKSLIGNPHDLSNPITNPSELKEYLNRL